MKTKKQKPLVGGCELEEGRVVRARVRGSTAGESKGTAGGGCEMQW